MQVQQFVTVIRDEPMMVSDKGEATAKVTNAAPQLIVAEQSYLNNAMKNQFIVPNEPTANIKPISIVKGAERRNDLRLWWIVSITAILLTGLAIYAKRSKTAKKH